MKGLGDHFSWLALSSGLPQTILQPDSAPNADKSLLRVSQISGMPANHLPQAAPFLITCTLISSVH